MERKRGREEGRGRGSRKTRHPDIFYARPWKRSPNVEQLLSGQIERSRGNRGSERERRERKVALVVMYRVSRVRVVRDNSARKIRTGNEEYNFFARGLVFV